MLNLAPAYDAGKSPGRRAIELMREAQEAGNQQVTAFLETLDLSRRQAAEIAAGGEVYPAGVRDVAEKLAEHVTFKAQALHSIMRSSRPELTTRALTLVASVEPVRAHSEAHDVYQAGFPE